MNPGKERLPATSVLSIRSLCIDVVEKRSTTRIVDDVSLDVAEGEVIGVVGESGAGKSMTAWSVLQLLEPPVHMSAGQIRFGITDLGSMTERDLRHIRGGPIGVVVQNPKGSLNPMQKIGQQLQSVQRRHRRDISRVQARQKSVAMLSRLGLGDSAGGILAAYPHELSGGMAQRVVLAMALINDPRLLIADEPTSGLDATLQLEILEQIKEQVAQTDLSVLMVTHELGLVANFCDRVYVMSRGKIVEHGEVEEVFSSPQHSETERLLAGAD
jgi:ABC-type dipeptide/oligopeptide/nickel transport system ATPase component